MCEPMTLAIAGLAMSAVSTGAGFIGQMNQQAAMGAQANYQSQVQRRNAQISEKQARDAETRGQIAEEQSRLKTAQQLGTQQAALASQGTDLDGSPIDILGDTRRAGEFDALTIRSNAAREAWGYRVAGTGQSADAAMRGSFQPSYLGAGSSLLSGASSLADKWSKFQTNNPGGFGGGADPTFSGTGMTY